MINEFWNLVVETWEQGIRGIGIDNIIICLVILIGSLIARSLMNTYLLDKIAKITEKSETTLDDEIIDSLRGPFGLIPIAFGLYLITSYLPSYLPDTENEDKEEVTGNQTQQWKRFRSTSEMSIYKHHGPHRQSPRILAELGNRPIIPCSLGSSDGSV